MIVRVALALAACAAPALADPWQAQTEAGLEYDSNVNRVEDAGERRAAALARTSARLSTRRGAPKLRWSASAGGSARKVVQTALRDEYALTGAVDLGASRRAGEHLAVGARATHYEVWAPLEPGERDLATRAFASSGADLSVAIDDELGRRAAIAVGLRRLVYKSEPDHDFDWTGPAIAIVVEDPVWRGDEDRAIDLSAGYRLERRSYQGLAYQDGCAPGEERTPACFVPGDRLRADLVHVAGVRATYTGARVASLAYELTVDDSTSFGSTLVRQRVTASITTPLPARIFATATLIGQLDHYPEPPLVAYDLRNPDPTSIDNESRSGAAIRFARALAEAWQLEVRWSIQASTFADDETPFRRQLAYAGVTWER